MGLRPHLFHDERQRHRVVGAPSLRDRLQAAASYRHGCQEHPVIAGIVDHLKKEAVANTIEAKITGDEFG